MDGSKTRKFPLQEGKGSKQIGIIESSLVDEAA